MILLLKNMKNFGQVKKYTPYNILNFVVIIAQGE